MCVCVRERVCMPEREQKICDGDSYEADVPRDMYVCVCVCVCVCVYVCMCMCVCQCV